MLVLYGLSILVAWVFAEEAQDQPAEAASSGPTVAVHTASDALLQALAPAMADASARSGDRARWRSCGAARSRSV